MSVKLRCPTAPGAIKKIIKKTGSKQTEQQYRHVIICKYYMATLTILVGAQPLRRAARAVSRGGEAQY